MIEGILVNRKKVKMASGVLIWHQSMVFLKSANIKKFLSSVVRNLHLIQTPPISLGHKASSNEQFGPHTSFLI